MCGLLHRAIALDLEDPIFQLLAAHAGLFPSLSVRVGGDHDREEGKDEECRQRRHAERSTVTWAETEMRNLARTCSGNGNAKETSGTKLRKSSFKHAWGANLITEPAGERRSGGGWGGRAVEGEGERRREREGEGERKDFSFPLSPQLHTLFTWPLARSINAH